MVAAEASADYLMFGGPEIALTTTEEQVGWASELFELPCVAFASSADEVAPLIAAGADFVALEFVWQDSRGAAAAIAETADRMRLPEPVS
jgi:thiamine-phosphate pyrophosphorylase